MLGIPCTGAMTRAQDRIQTIQKQHLVLRYWELDMGQAPMAALLPLALSVFHARAELVVALRVIGLGKSCCGGLQPADMLNPPDATVLYRLTHGHHVAHTNIY
jgi:hypothetical protein